MSPRNNIVGQIYDAHQVLQGSAQIGRDAGILGGVISGLFGQREPSFGGVYARQEMGSANTAAVYAENGAIITPQGQGFGGSFGVGDYNAGGVMPLGGDVLARRDGLVVHAGDLPNASVAIKRIENTLIHEGVDPNNAHRLAVSQLNRNYQNQHPEMRGGGDYGPGVFMTGAPAPQPIVYSPGYTGGSIPVGRIPGTAPRPQGGGISVRIPNQHGEGIGGDAPAGYERPAEAPVTVTARDISQLMLEAQDINHKEPRHGTFGETKEHKQFRADQEQYSAKLGSLVGRDGLITVAGDITITDTSTGATIATVPAGKYTPQDFDKNVFTALNSGDKTFHPSYVPKPTVSAPALTGTATPGETAPTTHEFTYKTGDGTTVEAKWKYDDKNADPKTTPVIDTLAQKLFTNGLSNEEKLTALTTAKQAGIDLTKLSFSNKNSEDVYMATEIEKGLSSKPEEPVSKPTPTITTSPPPAAQPAAPASMKEIKDGTDQARHLQAALEKLGLPTGDRNHDYAKAHASETIAKLTPHMDGTGLDGKVGIQTKTSFEALEKATGKSEAELVKLLLTGDDKAVLELKDKAKEVLPEVEKTIKDHKAEVAKALRTDHKVETKPEEKKATEAPATKTPAPAAAPKAADSGAALFATALENAGFSFQNDNHTAQAQAILTAADNNGDKNNIVTANELKNYAAKMKEFHPSDVASNKNDDAITKVANAKDFHDFSAAAPPTPAAAKPPSAKGK